MSIRMYQKNSDFFCLIRMDDECSLDSIFWIQDAICNYCWSQPSWRIHIVCFNTPISQGHRDIYLHIMCKRLDKFKGLIEKLSEARKEFRSVVYNSLTKSMFENNWNQFAIKYGLEINQWLIKLYSEREHRFSWI
ncbi:hypothetical protein M9H77_03199 [Catharanthus roseus]|uniref:Uncharacterized protein n=1 Tax=Catharanthus roseus TaxID=4058 RepID=A0ACC0CB18_CATRO|nr:hypothetical protein M9H77_03199 [Catharanthus roseus]